MSQTLSPRGAPAPQIVSFPSSDGTVVGHLHLPHGHDPSRRYPAVAVSGSFSSVKEQMGDLYATELARRGVMALAIDYRNYGQSSGAIRQYEDPAAKAVDLSSALAFLRRRSDVSGTGLLGICTSGGTVLYTVAENQAVGAVATIAGFFAEPSMMIQMRGAEGVESLRAAGRAAKENHKKNGVIDTILAYSETDQTAANVAPLPYYFDPARGAVPEWRNAFAVMAWDSMLDFDPVSKASKVTAPTLVIHSDGSAFPEQARKVFDLLAGPKELHWAEGGHLDFYDQAKQVHDAADRAAAHFRTRLG